MLYVTVTRRIVFIEAIFAYSIQRKTLRKFQFEHVRQKTE